MRRLPRDRPVRNHCRDETVLYRKESIMVASAARKAELYRMVTPEHICPWGLKALDRLKREGFEVEDHRLKSREQTDAFKAKHQIETTPQTFIGGQRVGGYDDLREYLGKEVSFSI
jgi:glutaredoxin